MNFFVVDVVAIVVVVVCVVKSTAFTGMESTYVVNDAGILGNIGDEAIIIIDCAGQRD